MSNESRDKRERRRTQKMWEQDPRCHWCKTETIFIKMNGGKPPQNAATIDHLFSRYHPLRHVKNNGEQRTVLACWQCNNNRSKEETASLPREELWKRCNNKVAAFKAVSTGIRLSLEWQPDYRSRRMKPKNLTPFGFIIMMSDFVASDPLPKFIAYFITGCLNKGYELPVEVRRFVNPIAWMGLIRNMENAPEHSPYDEHNVISRIKAVRQILTKLSLTGELQSV